MKKKNNIVLGIIIAIIILLIGIICAVLVIAKSKENLDKDNKSTSTSTTTIKINISTSITTTRKENEKTTTGGKISTNIPEGYEIIDKSDIDYSKKLKGQRSFNMVPIEKTKYKEFNLADFEKKYDSLLIKRDGNKLNFYDNHYNYGELLLTISNFSKLLYGVKDYQYVTGFQDYEYTFIVYNNDNSIKIYQLGTVDGGYFYVSSLTIDDSNAKLYIDGDYSEELYNLFLKKDNGDYYNLKNKTTYGAEKIKNAIWISDDYSLYVTKENEVYFEGNKVNDAKFLAAVYYDYDCDPGLLREVSGMISSDFYYYFNNNGSIVSKKIKNLYGNKMSYHDDDDWSDYYILIETEDSLGNSDVVEGILYGDSNYITVNKK